MKALLKDYLTANEMDFALGPMMVEMMASHLAYKLGNSTEGEKETPTVLLLEIG